MTEVLPGLPMFTRRLDLPDGNESLPTTLKMASATLPIDVRIRSRARIALDGGGEAGFILPRGHLLRGGDVLADETGQYLLRIQAAAETVSTLYCDDPLQLARACYHLGNRHVPLQIGPGFARYQHDHVLDDMLVQMGLHVVVEQAPFEPEAGAYQSAPHGHSQGHVHDHGQGQAQGAGHRQAQMNVPHSIVSVQNQPLLAMYGLTIRSNSASICACSDGVAPSVARAATSQLGLTTVSSWSRISLISHTSSQTHQFLHDIDSVEAHGYSASNSSMKHIRNWRTTIGTVPRSNRRPRQGIASAVSRRNPILEPVRSGAYYAIG